MSLAIYILFGIANAALILGASILLGPRRQQPGKNETYECGVPLWQGARHRFQVKFYLVAILFVLFDIEVVFMIPWAVSYGQLGILGLLEMLVFVALLGYGLFYAWWRGALKWD